MGYTDRIAADSADLLRQASMTAEEYFIKAVRAIDERFGEGYARDNPALVASFMQTAAVDFQTAMWGKALDDLSEAIFLTGESFQVLVTGGTADDGGEESVS